MKHREETTEEWMHESFGKIVDTLHPRFPAAAVLRVVQGAVTLVTLGLVRRILPIEKN